VDAHAGGELDPDHLYHAVSQKNCKKDLKRLGSRFAHLPETGTLHP